MEAVKVMPLGIQAGLRPEPSWTLSTMGEASSPSIL